MKIAYCGNFLPEFSTESDLRWTLQDMGHQVEAIQESGLEWKNLPTLTEGCELFFWTRTAGFDPPDFDVQRNALGSLDMPTVGVHLDRWWGLRRESTEHGPADPDASPFFFLDYLFTADGGHDEEWRSIGANHFWMPPAIAKRNAYVGIRKSELWAEVGFVGNIRRYGHEEWAPYRQELYKYLSLNFRRFRIWEGGVRGQMLADVYASVDVLIGDSCLAGGATRYFSDRTPECLGRGGFLIHPWVEGVHPELYPEGTLVTYTLGDFDQLGSLVNQYLADPEERAVIAEVGRGWVNDYHLYHHRMEQIFEVLRGDGVV